MMNIPQNIFYGRFKLESCFVVPNYGNGTFCKIIINGIEMSTGCKYLTGEKSEPYNKNPKKIAEEVRNALLGGECLPVAFDNSGIYLVEIENKTWVCIKERNL